MEDGRGPTWITGSFDPDLNLIYWGTGNPGPPWEGDLRAGDNLYSNCVIALDADKGELKWWFQFSPHDDHDWDSTQVPVLVDADFDGRRRRLMLWGNRNAFFYVLDRETGEFLLAREFAKQTWASGIDRTGRPILRPSARPSPEGTLVYPGADGATNWFSPSYSLQTSLFYLPVCEDYASRYFSGAGLLGPGATFTGELPHIVPSAPGTGFVRALVPQTGEWKWEHKLTSKTRAGLLSTAGNLLFGGTNEGRFFALDASSGKELWSANLGAMIVTAPVAYLSDQKQHIAIAAGSNLFAFELPDQLIKDKD